MRRRTLGMSHAGHENCEVDGSGKAHMMESADFNRQASAGEFPGAGVLATALIVGMGLHAMGVFSKANKPKVPGATDPVQPARIAPFLFFLFACLSARFASAVGLFGCLSRKDQAHKCVINAS